MRKSLLKFIKKSNSQTVAFFLEIMVSAVLMVIPFLPQNQNLPDETRFAFLSANIVLLFTILQFSNGERFKSQKEEINKVEASVNDSIEKISESIDHSVELSERALLIQELYLKIYSLDGESKEYYKETLDNYINKMRNLINDKRSGGLSMIDYYKTLHNLADELYEDKANFVSSLTAEGDSETFEETNNLANRNTEILKDEYNGNIWALSFLLDDEWDDTKPKEKRWFSKLKELEDNEIPTIRLWVLDTEMIDLITKDHLSEGGKRILKKFGMYCSQNSEYPLTTSYVLLKEDLESDDIRIFGKGFFATKLHNNELNLIRGVCFDNLLSSNSLGGEIDFDLKRTARINALWNEYVEIAKKSNNTLNEYLWSIAGEPAKEFMLEEGYKLPEGYVENVETA